MAAGTDLVERTPVQEVVARVRSDQFKRQVALALPSSVRPERFQRAVVTAILQNPEVVVDPDSLFNSAIQCAQDGLIPDGREAAFVVFTVKGEKKVQYMPMIGGLRKIAAEHDLTVEAYVVYENDTFEWELGFSPTVTHKPPKLNEARGEAIGAYAVATHSDTGQKFLEVMSRGEIEDVRKVSRAAQNGPWVNWWGEMARKTVARRLFKQLPLGELDEREEQLLRQADVDVDLPDTQRMTVDEANITAGLTVRPPADADRPADIAAGTAPATPAQHAALLALIVDLSTLKPDVDHQAAAVEYAQVNFEKALTELTATEADDLLEKMREQLANGTTS